MPAVKTTAKKPAKTTAKTPVQKAAKKETFEDRWAAIEKGFAEMQKVLKETQRVVGDLGNRFGDIAEHFLTPGLRGKFEKFGFSFGELSRNVEWENKNQNISMELDALLENGTQAMVVEVKAKLDKADIDEQIGRMEKVRRYADLRGDARQFYCAMAALSASGRVIEYALSHGFYLIMPSGEDVKVTKPASEPMVW
ncbi:MAG: hypothetical protein LBI91_05375 [Spirochaetaceae bacterium]|jgi:hypothetical protein|nr:hypothetical protein [Spirochaetaceae bacterium]